jgi:hypothetical protein
VTIRSPVHAPARSAPPSARAQLGWFLAWAVAGALYAVGVAGAASVGIFVFPVAIAGTILLSGQRRGLVGLPGIGLGAGGVLEYLAWVNRRGPGTVCSEQADGFRCVSEWSPWPFLAAGVVAVVAALVVFQVLRSRRWSPGR